MSVVPQASVIRIFSARAQATIEGSHGAAMVLVIRGIMGTLLAITFLPKLTEVNRISRKLLASWKRMSRGMDSEDTLQLNAHQSLRIAVGSFYYFQRHTAMRIAGSIFYFTGKLILLLKS